MLNIIYWPISAVMWFWHKVFGFALGEDSGLAWALSIIFLVVTIRVLLIKPVVAQMRSARKMQDIQPKMQELRNRYKNDQQKLAVEMRKLQKEQGFNPLASCLPMFIQIPVFLGLFHVLRSFDRTGNRTGELGMTAYETRHTRNYAFSIDDVQSFLDARLFGTPLSAYMFMNITPERIEAYGNEPFTKMNVVVIALPLMLICAAMTHLTAKTSMQRNKRRQANQRKPAASQQTGPDMTAQMEVMNRMMVWIFPFFILATGMFWQVGLLLYMTTNNLWTFFQQRILFGKMDQEEEDEQQAKLVAQKASAPKPGQKPKKPKKSE